MTDSPASDPRPAWLAWTERVIATLGLGVVVWVMATESGAVVHGHPAYGVLLAVTVVVAAAVLALSWGQRPSRRGWRRVLRIAAAVGGLAWVAFMGWLRPFSAVEPALGAMISDDLVTVTETPTQIVFMPTGRASEVALEFQPGARVDPRAYAAVLRPLAEAGHPVVVTKQPLGIAFLAMGGYDQAREAGTGATIWAVGGHSLGGTVAAMTASSGDTDAPAGLLLYASYPASEMSGYAGAVLSISGSNDGLATPTDIDASRADLPASTTYLVIDGGVHAQFGSYGPQPGDGTPSVSDAQARDQIAAASLALLDSLGPDAP